ncbi:MAG TPA: aspartate carbamoyltransferase catalytic subunit [Nitriliruptoraceae bacterium]|nr:aspartate carbamoyltransferase catalytic subunit [Nitriliruptoraceae bacterium]
MTFRRLIAIDDLDVDDLQLVLDTAEVMDEISARRIKKVPTLRGRTVCNMFFEDSTRTRLSFDIAAKRLSADVMNFSGKGSSVSKGESFKDTALTLDAMGVDAVVIRSSSAGAPLQLTRHLDVPVLNAGDGWHQHPTQALLDLYTMRSHFGRLEGLTVTICGDIIHSRVARSEIEALNLAGATVRLVAPSTLLPTDVSSWDVEVVVDLDDALADSDVVYMLRVQRERMHRAFFPSTREYARLYGLDARRLQHLPDHAIVMHPGPMNRGVEITPDVADSPRALITDQVNNGIAVRMACLYLLIAGSETQ